MPRTTLAVLLACAVASPASAVGFTARPMPAAGFRAAPIPMLPASTLRLGSTLTAPALSPLSSEPLTPASVPVDDAGAFAARAQELFAGRPLAPGETLGIAWSREALRPEGSIPGDGELTERVARSPLSNVERMKALVELFRLGGASDADIALQDAGRGQSNVIVTKRGRTDRVIVVGAHYDKVGEGNGVIDNWTGASMVANLHQALHGVDTDATIVFIGFAREEDGLIGSSQYVRSLTKEQRGKIDAMINLDTLAVDGTFAWQGNSTQVLVDRVVEVAARTGRSAQAARLSGGDADSSTFRRAGIPAVTLFGASQDVIFDIIHSERDTMAAFDFAHYKNAYLLVIEVLKSLDAQPLGAEGRRRV